MTTTILESIDPAAFDQAYTEGYLDYPSGWQDALAEEHGYREGWNRAQREETQRRQHATASFAERAARAYEQVGKAADAQSARDHAARLRKEARS